VDVSKFASWAPRLSPFAVDVATERDVHAAPKFVAVVVKVKLE
jgi:hypothetical protein